MNGVPVLAAGNIMKHLEPRYEWHWPFGGEVDLAAVNSWVELNLGVNPDITTHVVMLGIAAIACLLLFIPVARSYVDVPRGLRNFLEAILLYIRDEMVYPWMGEKDGRRLLPYFWGVFFFILASNLIGLLPSPLGITPTGNWNVTGALAAVTLAIGIVGGVGKKGPFGFLRSLVPHGVDWWLAPLIVFLELVGLLVRHVALMIRLFANMTAGHAILAVLALWLTLTPILLPVRMIQAVGSVAMASFEIFIALVQAYIFTILSAIYIGLSFAEEH